MKYICPACGEVIKSFEKITYKEKIRYDIISFLNEPQRFTDIYSKLGHSKSTISSHLKNLINDGIVGKTIKLGNAAYYIKDEIKSKYDKIRDRTQIKIILELQHHPQTWKELFSKVSVSNPNFNNYLKDLVRKNKISKKIIDNKVKYVLHEEVNK